MYQTVTESTFISAFRSIRPENFSLPALGELFQHLEELEDDLDEQMELAPIAICCDWAEYTAAELLREYGDQSYDPEDALEEISDADDCIPAPGARLRGITAGGKAAP